MKPISDSLAAAALVLVSGCSADTDRRRYIAGDPGVARLDNQGPVPVHLDGPTPYRFEQRVGGRWVDAGLGPIALYDVRVGNDGPGFTEIVPPERSTELKFFAPDTPGTYRLRFEVGLQGERDAEDAGPALRSVTTPPFRVAELSDETLDWCCEASSGPLRF